MSKLERMGQSSVETLVQWCVDHHPGITSAKLYDHAKEWYGKLWQFHHTCEFEQALERLRGLEYRCTNQQWYPRGHVAVPKAKGPGHEDPRQTRMFG